MPPDNLALVVIALLREQIFNLYSQRNILAILKLRIHTSLHIWQNTETSEGESDNRYISRWNRFLTRLVWLLGPERRHSFVWHLATPCNMPYPFAPTLRKGNLIKGVNWKEIRLNTSSTFYPPSNFVVGFVPTHLSNVVKDSNISIQVFSKEYLSPKAQIVEWQ